MESVVSAEAIARTLAGAGVRADVVSTSETIRTDGSGGPRWTAPPEVGSLGSLAELRITSVEADAPDLLLESRLGKGGMGVVWAARERTLDRVVAVKRLHPDASEATVAALIAEAKITARLDHPNIVPIHFVASDESGAPVVVMKRIRGRPWRDVLGSHGGLRGEALDAALAVLIQVTRALEFAHARGVVHRDVKTENVMVGEFGEVYLVDWGLAVVLEHFEPSDDIVGTAGYMAPEMVGRGRVDERTDVYLLGSTLHELVTGRMRHAAGSLVEALASASLSEAACYPADVPEELAAICERACHRDPSRRYAGAAEFRGALEAFSRRRAAVALLRGAKSRAEAFLAALEDARSGGASAEGDLRGQFNQAVLAYEQVLDGWPDLEAAVTGHDRTVRAMLVHQSEGPDPSGARPVYELLREPSAEDRAALDRAEQRARSMQEAVRQTDPRTGLRERTLAGVVVTAGALVVTSTVLVVNGLAVPSSIQLVWIMVAVVAVYAAGLAVALGRMRRTLLNRMVIRAVGMAVVTMLAHRLLALRIGTPPTTTITVDLLILGFAVSGLAPVSRAAWPAAAACFAGAVGIVFVPAQTMNIFALLVSILPGVFALEWLLRMRREHSPDDPGDAAEG